jgi:hypothetical protein
MEKQDAAVPFRVRLDVSSRGSCGDAAFVVVHLTLLGMSPSPHARWSAARNTAPVAGSRVRRWQA